MYVLSVDSVKNGVSRPQQSVKNVASKVNLDNPDQKIALLQKTRSGCLIRRADGSSCGISSPEEHYNAKLEIEEGFFQVISPNSKDS